jgi:type I restriction enzyme S subunit
MTNWQKVKIGDLFNIEKGSLQSSKCTVGDFDFITASSEWKTHNEYTHEEEALIVAVAASGSLGRVHYVNGKFIASDLCFVLTPKFLDKYPLDLEFYFHVLRSIRDDLVKSTATGTSKLAINKGNFSNYEIPYFDIDH